MYNGELYDVAKALELGMVDELADEDNLIHRAMNMVKSWSSNPGRGFSLLKETMRKPAENIMRKRLGDENWAEKFNCLLDPDTRNALAIVKKMMGD
jgi:enoyl-CoA hydratase